LKHLLATRTFQVQGEDAYHGHLVLRLLAGMVLLYTARVLFKAQVMMEEFLFGLKYHWRFLESERLEFQGLSWCLPSDAACTFAVIMIRKTQTKAHAALGKREYLAVWKLGQSRTCLNRLDGNETLGR